MDIRSLLAVRGWPAVCAWALASVALLGGLYIANEQVAYEALRTDQQWGAGSTGAVIATSGDNDGITTALIRYKNPVGTDQDVMRIMSGTTAVGSQVTIWQDASGDVFVRGAASDNRYNMWQTRPGPSPVSTYLICMVIAAVIALAFFAIGESTGYLLTRHRI